MIRKMRDRLGWYMTGIFRFVYLFIAALLLVGVSGCGLTPQPGTTTSVVQTPTSFSSATPTPSVSPETTPSLPATKPAAAVSRVVLAEMFTGDW